MCIYWVKYYQCGHYADFLLPTLHSHCREFDTVLRYWHDQVYYQPLEASSAEYGTLTMPQPCRPIWPIPFPGHAYLPLSNGDYPRGLARPLATDPDIPQAAPGQLENPLQSMARENYLIDKIDSFRAVAVHQEHQSQLSIANETASYQSLYPSSAAKSVRLAGIGQNFHPPPYPHHFVSTILAFNARRARPDQVPNVIIRVQETGCLRTPHERCNYDPTNVPGTQCPWLLATRTPWTYPADSTTGIPFPRLEGRFLADFNRRGGARSNHLQKDPSGSEIIKVALNRHRQVLPIPELVYYRLHQSLPEGPWKHVLPGQNPFAAPFVPGPPPLGVAQAQAPPVHGHFGPAAPVMGARNVPAPAIGLARGARGGAVLTAQGAPNVTSPAIGGAPDVTGPATVATISAPIETETSPGPSNNTAREWGQRGWEQDWVSEGGGEGNEKSEEEGAGERDWRSDASEKGRAKGKGRAV